MDYSLQASGPLSIANLAVTQLFSRVRIDEGSAALEHVLVRS